MRCLWLAWSLLTWLAAVLCTIGCLLPYWLKGNVHLQAPVTQVPVKSHHGDPNTEKPHAWKVDKSNLQLKPGLPTDLGLFRRCGYPVYTNHTPVQLVSFSKTALPVVWESGCGHYSHITNVPHTAWYIAFFALISACALLFFTTFFLFMLGFALYLISLPTVYRSCQVMLLSAGFLTLLSCALYPIGWTGNTEVQQACGEDAHSFNLGRCEIGWAYVLTCSGGLLSLFIAMLPAIFPKHMKRPNGTLTSANKSNLYNLPRHDNKPNPVCCCCRRASSHLDCTSGRSLVDLVPTSQPSPVNSLDAESVIYPSNSYPADSVFILPRFSQVSPAGSSSSPAASTLLEKTPSICGNGSHHHHQSSASLYKIPPFSGQTLMTPQPHPFVFTTYVPQRYSTGAILSQYHQAGNLHASHQLSQRVSLALNTDPLIYVAEEEELDAGEFDTEVATQQTCTETGPDNNSEAPSSSQKNGNHENAVTTDIITCESDQTRKSHSTTQLHQIPPVCLSTEVHQLQGHTAQRFYAVRQCAPSVLPSTPVGVRPDISYVPFPKNLTTPPYCQDVLMNETVKRKRSSCVL
ncbi:Lipoma HMGIC fusion partner [Paragonimus heterotremus]|uniref:Lipoma HMGIC fusion partner n=1 Tax=Paragonimus heterotremus TaxID=100268 RepID=A0A8J4SP19_9TREM|nr:Lipoma HMGIC fusion partner [Paragonimus heterotremus]